MLQVIATLVAVLLVAFMYQEVAVFKGEPHPCASAARPAPCSAQDVGLRSRDRTLSLPALTPCPAPYACAGTPNPTPPTLPGQIRFPHIFASEFGVTFAVLLVGDFCYRRFGKLLGAFASSAFYCVVAFYEASAALRPPAPLPAHCAGACCAAAACAFACALRKRLLRERAADAGSSECGAGAGWRILWRNHEPGCCGGAASVRQGYVEPLCLAGALPAAAAVRVSGCLFVFLCSGRLWQAETTRAPCAAPQDEAPKMAPYIAGPLAGALVLGLTAEKRRMISAAAAARRSRKAD